MACSSELASDDASDSEGAASTALDIPDVAAIGFLESKVSLGESRTGSLPTFATPAKVKKLMAALETTEAPKDTVSCGRAPRLTIDFLDKYAKTIASGSIQCGEGKITFERKANRTIYVKADEKRLRAVIDGLLDPVDVLFGADMISVSKVGDSSVPSHEFDKATEVADLSASLSGFARGRQATCPEPKYRIGWFRDGAALAHAAVGCRGDAGAVPARMTVFFSAERPGAPEGTQMLSGTVSLAAGKFVAPLLED